VKGEDQFHTGVVVDDFEGTLAMLTELFGYEWCDEMGAEIPVTLPDGVQTLNLRFAYSMTAPRLEIIRPVPGTLWMPAAGSGIHHLGYWSDDVAADAATLERRGFAREAAGEGEDGVPYWTYHRTATGPRIELVSRAMQPTMEQYFTTGKVPY
jgi:hypothetical protein